MVSNNRSDDDDDDDNADDVGNVDENYDVNDDRNYNGCDVDDAGDENNDGFLW